MSWRPRSAGSTRACPAVDEEGAEGGFYLFAASDLDRVLDDEERRVAGIAWGFDGPPTLEHGYLPVQAAASSEEVARDAGASVEEVTVRLDAAKHKLLAERGTARTAPRRETARGMERLGSCLTLVRSVAAPWRCPLRGAGSRRRPVSPTTISGDGVKLVRARAEATRVANGGTGRSIAAATLQDYAYVARGLIAFAKAHGREKHWELARSIVEGAWERFHTAGGWRLSDATRSSLRRYGACHCRWSDAVAVGGASRRGDARRTSLRRRCIARARPHGAARGRCRLAPGGVLPRHPSSARTCDGGSIGHTESPTVGTRTIGSHAQRTTRHIPGEIGAHR